MESLVSILVSVIPLIIFFGIMGFGIYVLVDILKVNSQIVSIR